MKEPRPWQPGTPYGKAWAHFGWKNRIAREKRAERYISPAKKLGDEIGRLLRADGAPWPVEWHLDGVVQVVTPVTWPYSMQPVIVRTGFQTRKIDDETYRELDDRGAVRAYTERFIRSPPHTAELLRKRLSSYGLYCHPGRLFIIRRLTARSAGLVGNILDFAEALAELVASFAREYDERCWLEELDRRDAKAMLDSMGPELLGW